MQNYPLCGESRENDFDVCWNCQYDFVNETQAKINANEETDLLNSDNTNYVAEAGKDLMAMYKGIVFQLVLIITFTLIGLLFKIETAFVLFLLTTIFLSLYIIGCLRSAANNLMKHGK